MSSGHEQPRTMGVEEEFLLVSGDARHLVAAGDRVSRLARILADDDDAADHELKQEQAEIGSEPCAMVAELRSQLVDRRRALAAAAASVDARIAALGTCPLAEQPSTTAADAVRDLIYFARPALDRYGDAGLVDTEIDRVLTCGTGADEQRALVGSGADMRALTAWACDRTTG